MQGKFIVVEGLEGAGKSSVIKLIADLIASHDKEVICTREPGGTPMAEAIRDCVKKDWTNEEVAEETELLLMYASRVQLLKNVIQPSLQQGKWVIGDRHDLSSQAYQGGGRQIDMALMSNLRDISLKGFEPDLTIYLDVEPEVGLARARGRGSLDRIEQSGLAFFRRTRETYLALANADPKIKTVDAMQDMSQVHSKVRMIVEQFVACQ